MADHNFKAGETYRIVWNESYYDGWTLGYFNHRDTWLLNYSPVGHTGVGDLITKAGQTDLLANRSTSAGYPYEYPAQDLLDASAGVVESITLIDSSVVENVNDDADTDAWFDKTTIQITADFKIKDDAVSGDYFLTWAKQEYNEVQDETYNRADYTIGQDSSVSGSVRVGIVPFPPERPSDYDPDTVWDPDTGAWVDLNALTTHGGGRYNQQLVVLGHKKIYYQELT